MQNHWKLDFKRVVGWAAVALVVAAGCTSEVARDPGKAAPQGRATAENGPQTTAPTVTAEVVDGAGYHAVLEKHRGSVVFVDYWATW